MKNRDRRLYIETVLLTIASLYALVVFNFASFYSSAISNMEELGQSNLSTETEHIQAYLAKGLNTLMITANGVSYMIEQGRTPEEIEKYLKEEAEYCQAHVDENFTGIYGIVNDVYIDGTGWIPDDDFIPEERDWYAVAMKYRGAPAIADPYLDAQTGKIITSVSCVLEDGKSVLAIDITLGRIHEMVKEININDIGYGFVITKDGFIVSHNDSSEVGKNYLETNPELAREVIGDNKSYFSYMINDKKHTIFTNNVFGQWYVVMVANNDELFHDIKIILYKNLAITIAVLFIMVFFYTFVFWNMKKAKDLENVSRQKMENLNMNVVKALAHTIDAKDRYTSGHSQRVADYAKEIARRMGKTEEEQKEIYYAGLLHDVGKIRVSKEVINKPGRLTIEEFEQIKIHPVTGYHILKDVYETKNIAEAAKFHHERYDGGGYPNGLTGENIPEIARIIGVADAYDAMASDRSYRDALPQAKVRSEILNGKGKQFDPDIADIMLQMIDEDSFYRMRQIELTRKNILVIDDDEIIQKMVKFNMREEHMYNVVIADSFDSAMKYINELEIHLVLLDINLPGKSGFEVFEKIREKYDMPVVFMTGDRNIETIKNAYSLGVEDYITKPIQPAVLKEVIHSVLND